MKKLILLFSLIIITSCSSNDDKPEKTSNSGDSFNPPAWIVGTWKETQTNATYTFTKDDIVYTIGGIRTSYKDLANILRNAKATYSIKETKTNDSYIAEFKSTMTNIFSFTKTNDNKMTSNEYHQGTFIKQ